MNRKLCAPADRARSWESIDWKKAEAYVKKLQMRIVKAQKDGHYSKVKTLQWLLTHSFYAKALAVKRVTSNKGKNICSHGYICGPGASVVNRTYCIWLYSPESLQATAKTV